MNYRIFQSIKRLLHKKWFRYIWFILIFLLPPFFNTILGLFSSRYVIELIISFLPYLVLVNAVYILFLMIILTLLNLQKIFYFLFVINLITFMVFSFPIIHFYTPGLQYEESSEENTLKVIAVNIWWKNNHIYEMKKFLEDVDADVMMLIELTDEHYIALKDFFEEKYPYSNLVFEKEDKPFAGTTIYSKYPLEIDHTKVHTGFDFGYVRTRVDVGDRFINTYVLHSSAPISYKYWEDRNLQLEELVYDVNANTTGDTIIAGDFNTTPWSNYYEQFTNSLDNSYVNVSKFKGPNFTWSLGRFGFLQSHIDHFFITEDLGVKSMEIKNFPGSDHKAVIVEISVR